MSTPGHGAFTGASPAHSAPCEFRSIGAAGWFLDSFGFRTGFSSEFSFRLRTRLNSTVSRRLRTGFRIRLSFRRLFPAPVRSNL